MCEYSVLFGRTHYESSQIHVEFTPNSSMQDDRDRLQAKVNTLERESWRSKGGKGPREGRGQAATSDFIPLCSWLSAFCLLSYMEGR